MPTLVNIHEAKTHLSRRIRRVEAGEEIFVDRSGHPVARLDSISPNESIHRFFGAWRRQITIFEDFDALPEQQLEAFYENPVEPESHEK